MGHLAQSMDRKQERRDAPPMALYAAKFKSFLFPEPYFSSYLSSLASKVPPFLAQWSPDEADTYVKYLKTWQIEPDELVIARRDHIRESHNHKISEFLKDLWNDMKYTDMCLQVENDVYKVHRILIACYAPFIFHKLERVKQSNLKSFDIFTHNSLKNRGDKNFPLDSSKRQMDNISAKYVKSPLNKLINFTDDNYPRKIRLKGISSSSFLILLTYMYTGIMSPNSDNFIPVLDASLRLFMYSFADSWIEAYEASFPTRTHQLLFRAKIARNYGWKKYLNPLNKILALDFKNLLISPLFMDLTFEELSDILSEDEVGVQNEIILYLSVLKWLSHDNSRDKYTVDLMKKIRWNHMTTHELYACLNPPLMKHVITDQIKSMIVDALNYDKKRFVKTRSYRVIKDKPLQLWHFRMRPDINKNANHIKLDKADADVSSSQSSDESSSKFEESYLKADYPLMEAVQEKTDELFSSDEEEIFKEEPLESYEKKDEDDLKLLKIDEKPIQETEQENIVKEETKELPLLLQQEQLVEQLVEQQQIAEKEPQPQKTDVKLSELKSIEPDESKKASAKREKKREKKGRKDILKLIKKEDKKKERKALKKNEKDNEKKKSKKKKKEKKKKLAKRDNSPDSSGTSTPNESTETSTSTSTSISTSTSTPTKNEDIKKKQSKDKNKKKDKDKNQKKKRKSEEKKKSKDKKDNKSEKKKSWFKW